MTVYPQEYKLNCIKIGFHMYSISIKISSTALVSYTNCNDQDTTGSSPCIGTGIESSFNRIKYTVNVTWNGMTVSSESISQATTRDQTYQCVLDNPSGGADRTRTLTIRGNFKCTTHV